MTYVFVALAPVIIILFYIYIRDKYNKEPVGLLIKSLIFGALIAIPVIFTEAYLSNRFFIEGHLLQVAYDAFIVAAFTEELFKFFALYFLIWKNKHFDEKFDGIVYAVFVSLGFAAVENIMYVYEYGHSVGLTRAITAVPAHAVFGVIMGYYFALAKFKEKGRANNFLKALFVPVLLHGIYDFILMTGNNYMLIAFIPYLFYLWRTGFKRIKELAVK
ncbi:MAG: PrsW family intramembrane metalloprotease [Bacteroidales bacterium]|nr:PrsW family intramembrane metalloprotease [Bacteroidales bacterium]